MNIVVCAKCKEILVSRHRHDCKVCKCDNRTMVDGGGEYCRYGGSDPSAVKPFKDMDEAKKYASN